MSVAYEAAKTAHFGAHPLGNSILGTVESITSLEAGQMRDYFARRYSPSNIVLAFAGKADWNELVELARAHCGAMGGGRRDPRRQAFSRIGVIPGDPPRRGPATDRSWPSAAGRRLKAPTAMPRTCWRPSWATTPDRGCTGRLIDPGLADGAELSYQDYNQAGSFFTFLSCEPEQAQANLGRIADLYKTAIRDGLTEDELNQAKNKVLARSVLRSERPMGRLASLGFHWMYRRLYIPVEEELEAFSRVTVEDLRRLLSDWPIWPLSIVSVGPTTEIQSPE